MATNSVYAALGRMRSTLLFETRQYRLSENVEMFEDLRKRYAGLVDGLNACHDVEVVIFFRIHPWYPRVEHRPNECRSSLQQRIAEKRKAELEKCMPPVRQVESFLEIQYDNLKLVCINCDRNGDVYPVSVSSKWAQDYIEILPDNQVLRQPGNNPLLDSLLAHYLTEADIKGSSGGWEGGNVLRGNWNKKITQREWKFPFVKRRDVNRLNRSQDFILSSISSVVGTYSGPWRRFLEACKIRSLYRDLGSDLNLRKEQIIDIGVGLNALDNDERRAGYHKLFFHADLYCTLVGPSSPDNQIVLVARRFDGKKRDELRLPDAVDGPLDKLSLRLVQRFKNRFEVIRLPLILLRDVNGKMMEVLSYNNCLVENYEVKAGRQINLYLPDYTEALKHFYSPSAGPNRSPDIPLILENIIRWLRGQALVGSVQNDPSKIDTLILEAQSEISVYLRSKIQGAFVNVVFVKYPFRYYAKRHGSLRCMTKVINRDMLPEIG